MTRYIDKEVAKKAREEVMPTYLDIPGIELNPDSIALSLTIISNFLGNDWVENIEHQYKTGNTLKASLENSIHPIAPWILAYREHLKNPGHPITNNLLKLERLADYIKTFESGPDFEKFAEKLRDKRTFLPTVFELQAAKMCLHMGCDVKFIPEKKDKQTSDFLIRNEYGEVYEAECKSLDQKPSEAQKEDSILSNALVYARKKQKKTNKYYTFTISAGENIGFIEYKKIIDEILNSKPGENIGTINTNSRSIEYLKLNNKEIYYAAKYNGNSYETLSIDYADELLKLPLNQHIIEMKGNKAEKTCKELFSFHTTTPYTRNIINAIKTRFQTARNQITKEGSGCIFIKIPEEYFSNSKIKIVENAAEEIKKEFKPNQNTRIIFVVIMASAFDVGGNQDLTFIKSVTIYNPYAASIANTENK